MTPAVEPDGRSRRPEDLYLDLLKRVLCRAGFESSFRILPTGRQLSHVPRRALRRVLAARGLDVVLRADAELRRDGRDWPTDAETMIGLVRLDNLQQCVVDVIRRGVPGDLIETGVWRGGATILMRGVLAAYGVTDRVVWAADSFEGLPRPDADRFAEDSGDPFWGYRDLAVSLDEVKANFARYGLLDDQVRFLPGWFRDTLPSAPIEQLAVLRLDGDMYESTIVALEALYPKLAPGGYVIVDDYHAVSSCRSAVDDYRSASGIDEPIERIDWGGAFWRRNA
ncbi:MAG TPA: TylF/MycF/NovP-related O-methyltransferase [Acidimicrobiales bacterium]|nr:TylF/MycF/NovP-related O-methyltransferase [Acidimicrobiales bacterium]